MVADTKLLRQSIMLTPDTEVAHYFVQSKRTKGLFCRNCPWCTLSRVLGTAVVAPGTAAHVSMRNRSAAVVCLEFEWSIESNEVGRCIIEASVRSMEWRSTNMRTM